MTNNFVYQKCLHSARCYFVFNPLIFGNFRDPKSLFFCLFPIIQYAEMNIKIFVFCSKSVFRGLGAPRSEIFGQFSTIQYGKIGGYEKVTKKDEAFFYKITLNKHSKKYDTIVEKQIIESVLIKQNISLSKSALIE